MSCDAERYRYHKQYRCHIIEERRAKCSNDPEYDQDAYRLSFDLLGRPDRNILEQSRLRGNAYDDHHSDEQSKCVEVNVMQSRLLANNSEGYHQDAAQHGNNGPVNLFRNNQCVNNKKYTYCKVSLLFHTSLPLSGSLFLYYSSDDTNMPGKRQKEPAVGRLLR
ncbi:hypothetical protein D3C71_1740150 [compost metagenome]